MQQVLIVDDEPDFLDVVEHTLKASGFDVTAICGTEKAFKLLDDGFIPDIGIFDIEMPGRTGVELAHHLKTKAENIPVVFVSGFFPNWDIDDLEDNGGIATLSKPFPLGDLVALVNKILDDQK